MIKLIVDRDIPFIENSLKGWCNPIYLSGREINREALNDAEGLLIRTYTQCNASLLEGSNIKFIATGTIGTDHIDSDYCKSHGITVCNAPGCNAPGVAQYVWSALAALDVNPKGLKIGVVGKGHVGSIVAEWGRRLGAEVIVCDPPRRDGGEKDENYVSLEELLTTADVVTLHTPLTKKGDYPTYHLLSDREFQMMRPGAILINASRGGVVDTDALRRVLKAKKIRGVIDTWEWEPEIATDLLPLVEIATPHIAGYSHEGKQRATRMILEGAGKYFGVTPDTTGLAGAYIPPKTLTMQKILSSYDPRKDMADLLASPAEFLKLRDTYHFRHEVE